MKNPLLYIFAAVSLLLVSCGKEGPVFSEGNIEFGIGSPTKGLLNGANLKTTGTTVKVFDIITGATAYNPTNNRHIDDNVVYDAASGLWGFSTAEFYLWPATGSQRFFGWLAYDAVSETAASSLVGTLTLDPTDNKTLRVPASSTLALTKSSSQFDFSYSNTVTRTGDSDKSQVALELDHLFTSFSFSAKNTSDNVVTIKSLNISNLRNVNNATISFEPTGTEVAYGTGSRSNSWTWSGTATVAKNATVNNLLDGGNSSAPSYYLMWPQEASDFTTINYNEATDTYSPANSSLCYITIVFNQGGADITRVLGFPLKAWTSGKRNLFTLEFANKLINVNFTVLPWELEDVNIEYSSGTVQANTIYTDFDQHPAKEYKLFYDPARLTDDGHGNLTVDNNLGQSIVDDAEKKVYVKNGMPVKVRFNLNSPEGAEWLISLAGDYQAFSVEKLTTNTVDGTNCDFQLVPKNTGIYASPTRNYEVNIRVALRLPSGRIVSADPVLQGPVQQVGDEEVLQNQYTIILPKV